MRFKCSVELLRDQILCDLWHHSGGGDCVIILPTGNEFIPLRWRGVGVGLLVTKSGQNANAPNRNLTHPWSQKAPSPPKEGNPAA